MMLSRGKCEDPELVLHTHVRCDGIQCVIWEVGLNCIVHDSIERSVQNILARSSHFMISVYKIFHTP